MKHASDKKISTMDRQLEEIRKRTGVTEKKPGAFYRKGEALLHFHEDPKGAYADLKSAGQWVRFRVETQAEWKKLFAELDKVMAKPRPKGTKS
jgi:hypothetical protein